MVNGDQWTAAELASVQMQVAPITTYGDLCRADEILSDGNVSWTGEDIRKRLFEAGFRVVRVVSD